MAFLGPDAVSAYDWLADGASSSVEMLIGLNRTWQRANSNGLVVVPGDAKSPRESSVAEMDKIVALSGSSVMPEWAPGLGSCCHGIWSSRWDGPEDLQNLTTILKATASPLLEHINNHECPFGQALPGDVTWRGSIPKDLQGIVAPQTLLTVVAVIYAYLPYFVAFCFGIDFGIRRGTRQLSIIAWAFLVMLVNEFVVKKVVSQPRPGNMLQMRDASGLYVGSCVQTCGMPSSHSAMSVGWFALILLDAFQWVHPGASELELAIPVHSTNTWSLCPCFAQVRSCYEYWRRPGHNLGFWGRRYRMLVLTWVTPFMPYRPMSIEEFLGCISFWSCVFLPVPYSRLVLHDHTTEQVLAGCLVGTIAAVVWWGIVRCLQDRYRHRVNDRVLGCLTHNYAYPHFMRPEDKEKLNGLWVVKDASSVAVKAIRNGFLQMPDGRAGPRIKFTDVDPVLKFAVAPQGDRKKWLRGTLLESQDQIYWDCGKCSEVWFRVFEVLEFVEYEDEHKEWIPEQVQKFYPEEGLYDLEGFKHVQPSRIRRRARTCGAEAT